MHQVLIFVGFVALFVSVILYLEYWQKQRRKRLFAAICTRCKLEPLVLEGEQKDHMEKLVREMLPDESVRNLSIKLTAHNPENGDFLCVFRHMQVYNRDNSALTGTTLGKTAYQIGGFSARGKRVNNYYRQRNSILLGRRLDRPLFDSPVYFKAFANPYNRDLLQRARANRAAGKKGEGAVGWLKSELEKTALAALEMSIPGDYVVPVEKEPLASMMIKADAELVEADILKGLPEEYWHRLTSYQKDDSVLAATQGWYFSAQPGWLIGICGFSHLDDEDAERIWNNLLLV